MAKTGNRGSADQPRSSIRVAIFPIFAFSSTHQVEDYSYAVQTEENQFNICRRKRLFNNAHFGSCGRQEPVNWTSYDLICLVGNRSSFMILQICLAVAMSGLASAQWLDYPTPGIPRLPNGKV